MLDARVEFSEDERDAAEELFNLGMGRAAAMFSRMVGTEVELSVPRIDFVTIDEVIKRYEAEGIDDVAAVSQQFRGTFAGHALLIFPRAESMELARILLQDDADLESMTELEQDALTEVGNLVLNGCLGVLANTIAGGFHADTPDLAVGPLDGILGRHAVRPGTVILLAEIGFSIRSRSVRGMVVFALPIASVEDFRRSVARLLEE